MRKTLGDYNIEKSSSSDLNNISWSQKNQKEESKPRKKKIVKKSQIPSGTNIIYKKEEDEKTDTNKIFKIKSEENSEKSKEETGKRFENTAASLGQVKERSYKRPAR
jgi:transposase